MVNGPCSDAAEVDASPDSASIKNVDALHVQSRSTSNQEIARISLAWHSDKHVAKGPVSAAYETSEATRCKRTERRGRASSCRRTLPRNASITMLNCSGLCNGAK